MYVDTQGIVLRTTKLTDGRKLLVLFTQEYGKITCSSNLAEGGKKKSGLATRPFTYSKFNLYKKRDYFSVNSADVRKSYYSLGEDIDKYMAASLVLEYTDRVLPENEKSMQIFNLLRDYLEVISQRQGKYETLTLAYKLKTLKYLGCSPELKRCCCCGGEIKKDQRKVVFSISEGGLICESCRRNMAGDLKLSLIYELDFGMIDVMNYMLLNPLEKLKGLALNPEIEGILAELLKKYIDYHLDIGDLKSEGLIKSEIMRR